MDDFKLKILSLSKLERKTANAFICRGLHSKFSFPKPNETKECEMARKKLNSATLKKDRDKEYHRSMRLNESIEDRNSRLRKEAIRDRIRRQRESQIAKQKRLKLQRIRDQRSKVKCLICFKILKSSMLVGIPSNCSHIFCMLCLQIWTKQSNTCPLDRKTIKSITVKNGIDGKIVGTEEVEHVVSSFEEITNEFTELDVIEGIRCEFCGCDDREETLLICDQCGNSFHFDTCLPQPLRSIPEGDWFCSDCEYIWIPNGPTSN